MRSHIRYNHIAPQFIVKDIAKSVEFYSEILGFGVDYLSGSPPNYAVVFRDEVYIHLCIEKVLGYDIGPGGAFIVVNGIDEIWKNIQNKNIEIVSPLANRDYGFNVHFKVFTICDLDQNVLRIGEKVQTWK